MAFQISQYKLVARGEWGLACDDDGVAIGPIELVVRSKVIDGVAGYQCIAPKRLGKVAVAIYGREATESHEWFIRRLVAIARAMSNGQHALAREFRKLNPNWPDEPRDEHGRWTSDGENPIVPVIAPYSPECLAAIEAAKRICIDRYSALGGGLGNVWLTNCIRAYVPIDCGY